MTITVYSTPKCVQCTATKIWLKAREIAFVEVDVTRDAAAMERITGWGYRQAPVVEVGPDHHWCGFRPDLLREATDFNE